MRIEHYKMSKPYPPFKIALDGKALVISIGKYYFRFQF